MGKPSNSIRVLVTGGGGFVGSALVRRLVQEKHAVSSFSRQEYPWMQALGVQQFQGDLADFEALQKAVNQQDVILHTAAKAGFWGSDQSYFNTNVLGTENLIKASQEAGVNKLIYTSSASVVFGGSGIENGSVDLPYPDHPLNAYTKTKALAEKLVLDANAANLKTLSLRPHIVLGPGDQHILPRLLERAKSGQLRQIGSGKNQVDIVYIDNLVDAHLLAIDAIDNNPQCLGKSYFITNGEPVVLSGSRHRSSQQTRHRHRS